VSTDAPTVKFDQPRTIVVQGTEVLRTGSGQKGPWTLYKVHATEQTGVPIREELRTFDALPLGEIEVTAEARIVEDRIESYTLKPTKRIRPGASGGNQEARIAQLESQVADLTRKYGAVVRALSDDTVQLEP
jgi:hypothetical protein